MTKVTKNKIDNSQTDFTEKQCESPTALENNIKEPPKTKWRKIRRGAKSAFVIVFLG